MPIPVQPTEDQFAAVADAISPGSSVISTRKLLGGLGCRMDVVEFAKPDDPPQKVVTRLYWEHTDPNRVSPNLRENVSDEPLRDYGFWSMYSLYVKMPAPGLWAEDFEAMGGWKYPHPSTSTTT